MTADNDQWKTSLFQEKPWYQSNKKSPLSVILSVSAEITSKLPPSIQPRIMRWVDSLGLFVIRLFKILPLSSQPYYLIKGVTSQQNPLSILYHGDLSSFMFFINRLFPHSEKLTITPIEHTKKTKDQIRSIKKTIDIEIIEHDWVFTPYYQKKGYLSIPENISFLLPMTPSIQDIIQASSQSIQHDLKKALSLGYCDEITTDLKAFHHFYQSMYVPYVKWRYPKLEKIISFDAMRHFALRGAKLLFVNQNKTHIFGGIFEIVQNKIITQYAGINKGQFDHLQQGIITLSYYYLICIAQKHHLKAIDFGTSPPFLDDGLCSYKLRWNMAITKTNPAFSTVFAVKINTWDTGIQQFFENHPFFFYTKKRLSLAYHINPDQEESTEKLNIIKQNHLIGIDPTLYHSVKELISTKK